jgi:hypothetical protein
VSAQRGIFKAVVQMIEELDNEAAPKTTVQVVQVNGVSPEALQKALSSTVGKAWLGNRPEQQPNQTGSDAEKKRENDAKHNKEKNQNQEGEKKE